MNIKNIFNKIAKFISSIIFWFLIVIIIILIGYVVTIKVYTKQNRLDEIPINFYTILTQSMYPKIKAGDIIIDYKNPDNIYKEKDIITFVSDRSTGQITITHRVTKVIMENGKYYYVTKGDANNSEDTSRVPSENVIGKVVLVIPKLGYLQQFLVSKFGWLVAIVLPCLGIIIYDLIKVFKLIFKKPKVKKLVQTEEVKKAKDELYKTINTSEQTPVIEEVIADIKEITEEEIKKLAPSTVEEIKEEQTELKEEIANNEEIIESITEEKEENKKEEEIESLDDVILPEIVQKEVEVDDTEIL